MLIIPERLMTDYEGRAYTLLATYPEGEAHDTKYVHQEAGTCCGNIRTDLDFSTVSTRIL